MWDQTRDYPERPTDEQAPGGPYRRPPARDAWQGNQGGSGAPDGWSGQFPDAGQGQTWGGDAPQPYPPSPSGYPQGYPPAPPYGGGGQAIYGDPIPPGPARERGGRPPQWPDERERRATQQYQQQSYAGAGSPYPAPAAPPVVAPRPRAQEYTPAAPARHHADGEHIPLPHFHIAHVFLIVGVVCMWIALGQQWGTDASGGTIFVRSFASPRLGTQGVDIGELAYRAGSGIVIACAVLGAALIVVNTLIALVNRALGIIGLSGCATLIAFPLVWGLATLLFGGLLLAAGFGGLGALSQLPIVHDYALANTIIKQPTFGFYLWWGGIAAAFIGMLGQLVIRRR